MTKVITFASISDNPNLPPISLKLNIVTPKHYFASTLILGCVLNSFSKSFSLEVILLGT